MSNINNPTFWKWLFTVSRPFLIALVGAICLIIGGVNEAPGYLNILDAIAYTWNNAWGITGTILSAAGWGWVLYIMGMGFRNTFDPKGK